MSLHVEIRPGAEHRGRPAVRIAIVVATVAIAVTGVIAVVLTRPGGATRGPASTAADTGAVGLARQFLTGYLDPDGRVVRRDQGDDTVSEGQGYGMLLAVAAGDRTAFGSIWSWTRTHLQQPDGSLAWRWDDGRVVDDEPASDADLDVTRALQLAAGMWSTDPLAPGWDSAAQRIAAATLAHSTIPTDPGRVLVGGPWAVGSAAQPAQIAPSYIVAGEAEQLASTTGAAGWAAVARGTAALDRRVVASGLLAPDWTTLAVTTHPVTAVSTLVAAPAPDHSEQIAYGLDAPRLLIRLASSCDGADRTLAARSPRSSTLLGAAGIRQLDGHDLVSWTHPVTDVAAAAVRSAQGDVTDRDAALRAAATQERRSPTYYGAAWLALGTVLLTTRLLGSCAEPAA